MSKLTLSINETVREAAKKYAKETNTTVSKIVEDYLIKLMTQHREKYPKEIAELIGFAKVDEPPVNYKKAKLEYLKEKYLSQ